MKINEKSKVEISFNGLFTGRPFFFPFVIRIIIPAGCVEPVALGVQTCVDQLRIKIGVPFCCRIQGADDNIVSDLKNTMQFWDLHLHQSTPAWTCKRYQWNKKSKHWTVFLKGEAVHILVEYFVDLCVVRPWNVGKEDTTPWFGSFGIIVVPFHLRVANKH